MHSKEPLCVVLFVRNHVYQPSGRGESIISNAGSDCADCFNIDCRGAKGREGIVEDSRLSFFFFGCYLDLE